MAGKTKIHVIGSYAVGMTMQSARFPQDGETVPGYNFKQLHGGKGSNQAIGAARLGAEVKFTSCLGRDKLGDEALKMLKEEKINVESVCRSAESSTGVGFVMVGDDGENRIIIGIGANEDLGIESIEHAFSGNFDPDLLLVQLEANLEAVFHAIKLAHSRNIPVILNPAPYRPVPPEIVKLVSYLVPNESEAYALLENPDESALTPQELCDRLYNKFNVNIVLTAGGDGAYMIDKQEYQSDKTVKHFGVEEVETIDTTGAGDCFNAALAVALGEGKTLAEAVQIANVAATESVQVEGVVESLPYREVVEKKLNERI